MTKQEILDKIKSLKAEINKFDEDIYDNTEMSGNQLQRIDFRLSEITNILSDFECEMQCIVDENIEEEHFDTVIAQGE